MTQIEYAVVATLPDDALAGAYLAWLTKGGHVAEVVAAGASVGEVIRLDPETGQGKGIRVMSRYRFPSRSAFDAYLQDHAPRLRREGLARFGPERGVAMERFLGEVAHTVG